MSTEPTRLKVRISQKREIANQLHFFELTAADGKPLPVVHPGDHITVETPSGDNRRYSLASVSENKMSYCIVVKREADGRGGSISMADNTEVGDELNISDPNSEFDFVDGAKYLLIAGGIGITPIYSMWQYLVENDHPDFQLIYLTRTPEDTAFAQEFKESKYHARVHIHHSQGGRFDFWDLLMTPSEKHVYCCGPKSLIDEIKDMTGHWPKRLIHFEDFAPVKAIRADDKSFTVRLKSNDQVIEVGERETLLHALRQQGHRIQSSCESGTCGSCKVTYVNGVVDHRDLVLEPKERKDKIMVCVSRSAGEEILLDL